MSKPDVIRQQSDFAHEEHSKKSAYADVRTDSSEKNVKKGLPSNSVPKTKSNRHLNKDVDRNSYTESSPSTITNTFSDINSIPNVVPKESSPSSKIAVDNHTAYHLVEQVRRHTELSHELSRVAVGVVVTRIREILGPTGDRRVSDCLGTLLTHCQGCLEAPLHLIEETHDANRLRVIFTELTSCKDDSQQRSWMLHEDEPTIKEYINELTSILTNADASISRHMMSLDHYNPVSSLIEYYQMETRWTIRLLLLQTFGAMCNLDPVALQLMLNSILPMELARDMQDNSTNISRLLFSSTLLTMIFSMGEEMPVAHIEHLGLEFVTFLLDLIETPPDTDTEDQIPDRFLHLILAFNLQFADPENNVVLRALESRHNAKTFTERALVLVNREEDPVRVFDHAPPPPNSVLKLFVDLFTSTKTALLFYTNDIHVLIDIITRQLSDLSPGDKRRKQYLQLCQLVMRNSGYEEHKHRCDDILKCFTRIFCEESHESVEDQRLVRVISNEFPQYFKS